MMTRVLTLAMLLVTGFSQLVVAQVKVPPKSFSLDPGKERVHKIRVKENLRLKIKLKGDGSTNFDLQIHDEGGNLVDEDTNDSTLSAVAPAPARSGVYTVKVINRGQATGDYSIVASAQQAKADNGKSTSPDVATKVRLIHPAPGPVLDILTQNANETDEQFARRVTPPPAPDGVVGGYAGDGSEILAQMKAERDMIRNENLTQKTYELKALEVYKESVDSAVNDEELQVAKWQSEHDNNPELVTVKTFLDGHKAALDTCKIAQNFVQTRIDQVKRRSDK